MPTYPVMPSLSRAPSFDTVRKIEDGTLTTPMESGYVSRRPRFTRLRRTWNVTWKNLVAEDVRVLDLFETQVVQGGAASFLLPNLLPNGSFELAATQPGELVQGWAIEPSALWNVSAAATPYDGAAAVLIQQNGADFPATSSFTGGIVSETPIPVSVGDVYQVGAASYWYTGFGGDYPSSVFFAADVTYADGSQIRVTCPFTTPVTTPTPVLAYAPSFGSVTIPPGSAPALFMVAGFYCNVSTTHATLISQYPERALAYFDSVSLALISATQPYGRMPGTSALAGPVYFSKGLEIKDTKPTGSDKRYDVSCAVTEQ